MSFLLSSDILCMTTKTPAQLPYRKCAPQCRDGISVHSVHRHRDLIMLPTISPAPQNEFVWPATNAGSGILHEFTQRSSVEIKASKTVQRELSLCDSDTECCASLFRAIGKKGV